MKHQRKDRRKKRNPYAQALAEDRALRGKRIRPPERRGRYDERAEIEEALVDAEEEEDLDPHWFPVDNEGHL